MEKNADRPVCILRMNLTISDDMTPFLSGCYSVLALHHLSRFLFSPRERHHLHLAIVAGGVLLSENGHLIPTRTPSAQAVIIALQLVFLCIAMIALFQYAVSIHRVTFLSETISKAISVITAAVALCYQFLAPQASFSAMHYLAFTPALVALIALIPRLDRNSLHPVGTFFGLLIFLPGVAVELSYSTQRPVQNPGTYILLPFLIFETLAQARRSAQTRLSMYRLLQRLRRLHKRHQRAARALTEARIYAFQDRLNPHFLFNALNTLRSLIVYNPEVAENVLLQLAGLYRGILRSFSEAVIPITEEIEMLDNYIALESQRFMGYIHIEKRFIRLSDTLLIPPLTFQPLVENAIKHGRVHEKPDGRICVSVRAWRDGFICVVSDNGIGVNNASISKGTTVTSIEDRLAHYYGFARLRIRTNRRARKTSATLVCHSRRHNLATSARERTLSSLITA